MLLDPISSLLPSCPSSRTLYHHIAYPSTSITWLALAVLALVFCLIVLFKFNTVKVFKRVIHRDEISNSYWIVQFGVFCIKDTLQCAKYASNFPDHEKMSSLFSLAVALLHSFGAFSLSLALLHQYRWRSSSRSMFDMENASVNGPLVAKSFQDTSPRNTSSGTAKGNDNKTKKVGFINGTKDIENRDYRNQPPPVASTHYVSETTPFFRPSPQYTRLQWIARFAISFEMLFFLLMALYLIFIFVLTSSTSKVIYYLALAFYIVQRIPTLVLTALIVFRNISTSFDAHSAIGPTFWSRIILIFAVLFDYVIEVPINTWSQAAGSYGCVIKFASVPDILLSTGLISYGLFFIFLMKEFKRNVDACLWGATFNPSLQKQ